MNRAAPSSENARRTMQANRSTSRREIAFRKALWAAGARGYRLHANLPGRPDLAFPALRIVVFVHGCFWHRCPTCDLPMPRANADFWRDKLESNRLRDRRSEQSLSDSGWRVVIVWEHEIRPSVLPRAASLAKDVVEMRQTLSHRSDSRRGRDATSG